MAELTKPSDINKVWADAGDIISPTDIKIATGWEVEVPPRQFFNWLDNKQDQFNAYVNQHGIVEWDANTDYYLGKAYVMGSDGIIYKAVSDNGPSFTTQDPTTDVSDTYWEIAFAPTDLATDSVAGLVELATSEESQAFTDTVRAITPATLYGSFQGGNQSLGTTGYQKLPGGLIVQWGSRTAGPTLTGTVTFPLAFPTGCFNVVAVDHAIDSATIASMAINAAPTAANFTFYTTSATDGGNFFWVAKGR